MAETKPIPGPWEVRALNQYRKSFQVSVAAESYPHPDTAAATALLIAAAPELLEALRPLAALAPFAGDEVDTRAFYHLAGFAPLTWGDVRRAAAAIAKAEGRS